MTVAGGGPGGRGSHETVFPKNAERGTKPERKTGKPEQEMKKHIAELPLLPAPKPKEDIVSRALHVPEINYNPMEKLMIALVYASRRLTRMAKWHFELSAYGINYRPRTSIRDQVLADFISKRPDEDAPPVETPPKEEVPTPWTLITDGSSCLEGFGAGLILTNPRVTEFTYALRFEFDASTTKQNMKP
ncbi:hypothetical protein Tco_1509327 [Tanacetum coccineum]